MSCTVVEYVCVSKTLNSYLVSKLRLVYNKTIAVARIEDFCVLLHYSIVLKKSFNELLWPFVFI